MKSNCNKITGNRFETQLCDILAKNGFWVHNFAQNRYGQPADIIAVRHMEPYLIDCKDCEGDRYKLDRIEDNQDTAMTRWHECGNGTGWFAIRIHDTIYMLSFAAVNRFKSDNNKSALSEDDLATYGRTITDWLWEKLLYGNRNK